MNSVLVAVEMEGSVYPGLSSKGPSHNSVLILSSDTFLASTISPGGELAMGGMVGGDPWPPPRSSWKMGMAELFGAPPYRSTFIIKRLAWFCGSCLHGRAGEVEETSSPLVTAVDGPVGVIQTYTTNWLIINNGPVLCNKAKRKSPFSPC